MKGWIKGAIIGGVIGIILYVFIGAFLISSPFGDCEGCGPNGRLDCPNHCNIPWIFMYTMNISLPLTIIIFSIIGGLLGKTRESSSLKHLNN
tara:strand:+ start:164 stop:439 length:276 start_codon:yes stop_codon:yes gene_type:complete